MDSNALTSLIYFVGFGLFFYWMMRKGGCGMHGHGHGHGGHSHGHGGGQPDAHTGALPSEPMKDPVCGMAVNPARAAGVRHVAGHTFYLCSMSCLSTFDGDPEAFAQRAGSADAMSEHRQHAHRGC